MKKSRKVLMLSLMFLLIFTGTSLAAKSEVGVKIDGKALSEKGILEKGRTFVPVRAIFESGGAKVSWDNKKKAVIIEQGKDKIVLNTKGDYSYYNKLPMHIVEHEGPKNPVKLVDGRVYLPLRLMGYLNDYEVGWNPSKKIATLDKSQHIKVSFKEAYQKLEKYAGDVKLIYSPHSHYGSSVKSLRDDYFVFVIADLDDEAWFDSNYAVSKANGYIYVISPGQYTPDVFYADINPEPAPSPEILEPNIFLGE